MNGTSSDPRKNMGLVDKKVKECVLWREGHMSHQRKTFLRVDKCVLYLSKRLLI